jgi:hypothetical protein
MEAECIAHHRRLASLGTEDPTPMDARAPMEMRASCSGCGTSRCYAGLVTRSTGQTVSGMHNARDAIPYAMPAADDLKCRV